MPQWKPEDEALFAELCRRAEQQSREAALRAAGLLYTSDAADD